MIVSPKTRPFSSLAEKFKAIDFRNYNIANEKICKVYNEQHQRQTVAFNIAARQKYLNNTHAKMTIWQALNKLDSIVDESDPDFQSNSQMQHAFQTAESIRNDNQPDWFQVVGLLHDLGKLLLLFPGSQDANWSVVGDTFIVGCALPSNDSKAIFQDAFEDNPDMKDDRYNTTFGMYKPNCGLDNVMFAWGHDEYLFWRLLYQSKIPKKGLDMIRMHSCYPLHSKGLYKQFFKKGDEETVKAVQEFNKYDLYSKSSKIIDIEEVRPYYESLLDKYIIGGKDAVLDW